jgi:hypothetical protein
MVALNQNWNPPTSATDSAPKHRKTPSDNDSFPTNRIRSLLRARYYDTHTAEFISTDPLEYVDGMSLFRGYFVGRGVDPHGSSIVAPRGPTLGELLFGTNEACRAKCSFQSPNGGKRWEEFIKCPSNQPWGCCRKKAQGWFFGDRYLVNNAELVCGTKTTITICSGVKSCLPCGLARTPTPTCIGGSCGPRPGPVAGPAVGPTVLIQCVPLLLEIPIGEKFTPHSIQIDIRCEGDESCDCWCIGFQNGVRLKPTNIGMTTKEKCLSYSYKTTVPDTGETLEEICACGEEWWTLN